MDQNENDVKLEILRKKVFPTLTLDELREKKRIGIDVKQDFDSDADMDLLTALPKLETLSLFEPITILSSESFKTLEKIPTLKSLAIKNISHANEVLAIVLKMVNIQNLNLSWRSFGMRDLKCLSGMTHLKSLAIEFQNEPLPESFLEVLKTLPQLEELILGPCKFKAEQLLDVVKDFPNLHNLTWEGRPLTEEDNARLLAMKNLDSLRVERPVKKEDFQVQEEDLSFLNDGERFKELKLVNWQTLWDFDWDLPNVEQLDFEGTPNLRSIDFSKLPSLKGIEIVILRSSASPVELKDLDSLAALEWFKYIGPAQETSIFRQLEMTPRLRYLMLSPQTWLEPEDIPRLSTLKQLQGLSCFFSDDLTAEDLEKLETLPNLISLMVTNVKSPEILEAILKKLPALRTLTMAKAGDQEIEVISHFPNLRGLDIYFRCQFTEEGVQRLFSLKNLRQIKLGASKMEKLELHDLPNLCELTLDHWWNLKEMKLEGLPKLWSFSLTSPVLESITFRNVDEIIAIELENCRRLEKVSIGHAPKLFCLNLIGSDCQDLTSLVALPNLKELAISYHQMRQDLVLETLQELPKLESLLIECMPPGDEVDINFPRTISRHETLDDCPFTKEERDQVQKALPNCEITFAF